ncbi:hypothetical protein HMPREF1436_01365 [Helicobacter pylori GAMchJs136i]|nr:hypothetical protein HMPREF1436_01365 [Helicobacter pylori GAMchJs136i]
MKRSNAKDTGFFRLILGESLAFTLCPYNWILQSLSVPSAFDFSRITSLKA